MEKRNERFYEVAMLRSSCVCVREEHAYIASAVYLVITVDGGISNTQAIRRTGKMAGD